MAGSTGLTFNPEPPCPATPVSRQNSMPVMPFDPHYADAHHTRRSSSTIPNLRQFAEERRAESPLIGTVSASSQSSESSESLTVLATHSPLHSSSPHATLALAIPAASALAPSLPLFLLPMLLGLRRRVPTAQIQAQMWSAAARQSHSISLAQFSRSHASFFVGEK
jgi:hypothetical protein